MADTKTVRAIRQAIPSDQPAPDKVVQIWRGRQAFRALRPTDGPKLPINAHLIGYIGLARTCPVRCDLSVLTCASPNLSRTERHTSDAVRTRPNRRYVRLPVPASRRLSGSRFWRASSAPWSHERHGLDGRDSWGA